MHLKIRSSLSSFFMLLAICACTALHVDAQQTLGAITGTVTDATGNVLSGVIVTAVGEQTNLTRVGKSSGTGGYDLVNLPIGNYTLTFSHEGFDNQKYPSIQVQADRTVSLNAQLKVGSVAESVTVVATPLLNAVDTTNGYVLDRAQIDAVPLPTGSFTGLAILSPGVSAELPGGTGANSGLGNQPIWANGQRDTSNSFLLNGVDASNLFNGKSTSQVASARVVNNTGVGNGGAGGVEQSSASVYLAIGQALPTPAPETLSEVKVNASMYDAQQGSTSGAHIDVSTGSGSNQIHGTTYFHRGTDWLNAAPFFFKQAGLVGSIPHNEVLPQLHRYTVGGTVGIPIIKDKLFAYLGYQHVHVSDNEIGISRLTVPFGLTDDRSPTALAAIANVNFPTSDGSPAVNPASISPVALFLMQHAALPGEPGKYLIPSANSNIPNESDPYNASIPGTAFFKSDQAVADLDWNASARDTVAAKYYYQHDPTLAPYAFSHIPGFTQHLDTGSQVAALTNTLILTPNLSTTQTIGVIRMKAYSTNEQPFSAQDAGINTFGSSYFPGISIVDVLGNNSPNNTTGLFDDALNAGVGAFTQAPYTGLFQNRIMPSANAIWTHGRHTVTFGTAYSNTQLNIRNKRIGKGMIAAQDFAGFLNNQISYQNNDFTTTSLMLGNADRYYRSNQVGSYVQDKFQVTPTLSLTAGLRYDWNGGLTEKYGRLYNFDPSKYSYNETTGNVITNGFLIAGNNVQASPGVSSTTLTGRQWGIAPRLGMAWQPARFNSKVVVRSGFGLYYDRGELFSYLSPGYAAGEVTGGPFGVTQSPPFVNTIQCDTNGFVASPVSACTPDSSGNVSLQNPWGTTPGTPPTGKASDITNYLPSASAIENGAQEFALGVYDRANKLPYSMNYTLDVQWQPRNDLAIDIAYVGNLGRHQVIPLPFNQANIASASAPAHKGTAYEQDYTYGYAVQTEGFCYYSCAPANLPNGNPYLFTYEGGNIDLRVPYTGYSAESLSYKAAGISAYNALTAHIEKRLSHGLQAGFSYTYSHALDEQSALGLFYNGSNALDLKSGYGSSDFDRTHVINFTYSYTLPNAFADSSWKGKLLDNWSLVGLTVIQSGQPYSVIDYSGAVGSIYYGVADGITNPIVPLAPGCTAKSAKTGASGAFSGGLAKDLALKLACFTIPLLPAGGLNGAIPGNDPFETTFTTGQRNIFRQAYQKRADASLVKTAKLTERVALKYTFDVYNLTNTTSFDIPGDNVNQNGGFNPTPQLGQPASPACGTNGDPTVPNSFFTCAYGLGVTTHTIGSPRQIQMSLSAKF